jgi:hypothetical protein
MGCMCDGKAGKGLDFGVLLQGYGVHMPNDYNGADMSGFRGFAGVEDSIWPSTGAIDTETASLDATVKELGSDVFADTVSASNANYQVWLTAWDTFVADFNQWMSSSWFWNPTRRDELVDYRKRFNSLLTRYHAFDSVGAVTGGTQLVAGAAPSKSAIDTLADNYGKIVTGGIIIAAIFLAPTVIPLLKSGIGGLRKVTTNPRRRRRRGRR